MVMMMTKLSNRRRSPRCPVDFFVQEVRADRTYLHPALNLSTDGIYILVSDDRKALDGQKAITLEFTLPSGIPVRATGRIAWLDDGDEPRGLGVIFTDIDEGDQRAIRRFVEASLAAQQRLRQIA